LKKFFLILILLVVFSGLVFGIRSSIKNRNKDVLMDNNNSGDNYIHELNIPMMEIDSLNPILTTNKYVSDLLFLIYEPLVSISREESLMPVLATEWAPKDDLNWIVKLRKGVQWHNGTDFTAKDVAFTIDSILLETVPSIYKTNVSNIETVQIIDEYSVNFVLKEKDPFFMYQLIFPIIPEYYFKNGDVLNQDKNNIPVGTGAYQYVTTNFIEEFIQLESNKEWWNKNAETKLETIYLMQYPTYGEAIKAYKSAKVDFITTSMSDWAKKFGTIGNNIYSFESSTFDMIVPNAKNAILSESSVRKAILYAINRENIVSKVFDSNATVADIPIHNLSKNYYSSFQSDYNIDKAKQILLNSGWKNDGKAWYKNGKKLRFTILVNEGNAEQVRCADMIKENLSDIDISITIKKVNWNDFQKALNSDNFELALTSIDIKNELTLIELMKSDSIYNYANFVSQTVDDLIEAVYQDNNNTTMYALEKAYKDETPYIGLFFRNNTLLTNKSVKGSIEPTWVNVYFNMTSWCK